MTIIEIIILTLLIATYVAFVVAANIKYVDDEPIWLTIIALPINVVAFILLFPLVIGDYRKLKKDIANYKG